METWIVSTVLLAALAALLASGLWIALTLLGVGWIAMVLFTNAPAGSLMATTVWGASTSWALTALPLSSGWARSCSAPAWRRTCSGAWRLDGAAARTAGPLQRVRLRHLRRDLGLLGRDRGDNRPMTIPELARRGYDERLAIGSLAGAGTLGLLIPPSIIMIVYGVAADVSIARLFVAGVLPGIMLMLLFSGYIIAGPCSTRPHSRARLCQRLRPEALRRALPAAAVGLIGVVIGSIYAGMATPTEAAVIGVAGRSRSRP